ncbi:TPA: hypothetical protein SI878_004398 [Salmonella enterica]|nr:hypothetical protein [Salmonella enterica]
MQWLIVPAVLAALAFFNIFPSMPGFAYVILIVIYLIAALLENHIKEAATASRYRENQILERLEQMENHLESKISDLQQEIEDLKYEVKIK